jgi:imidazolonepropionase-like amidohydrolase
VEGIARCVEAGVDTIEHCSWQRPAGDEIDLDVAQRLAAGGSFVGDTTPGATADLARLDTPASALPSSLRQRHLLFAEMRAMGIKVVTHSDAMLPNRPFEDFPWCVVAASLYGGLTPEQAVRTATGLAADAVGLAGETGVLTPSLRADVLVVDGNVAADVRRVPQARWVLRDGVVVAAAGTLLAASAEGWRAAGQVMPN